MLQYTSQRKLHPHDAHVHKFIIFNIQRNANLVRVNQPRSGMAHDGVKCDEITINRCYVTENYPRLTGKPVSYGLFRRSNWKCGLKSSLYVTDKHTRHKNSIDRDSDERDNHYEAPEQTVAPCAVATHRIAPLLTFALQCFKQIYSGMTLFLAFIYK